MFVDGGGAGTGRSKQVWRGRAGRKVSTRQDSEGENVREVG